MIQDCRLTFHSPGQNLIYPGSPQRHEHTTAAADQQMKTQQLGSDLLTPPSYSKRQIASTATTSRLTCTAALDLTLSHVASLHSETHTSWLIPAHAGGVAAPHNPRRLDLIEYVISARNSWIAPASVSRAETGNRIPVSTSTTVTSTSSAPARGVAAMRGSGRGPSAGRLRARSGVLACAFWRLPCAWLG